MGTVNRELAALSHLLNKAVEWHWVDKRSTIKRHQEERGRLTYLTVEQIERMLAIAKQDKNPQIYAFILIGVKTSMRKMEILTIRREFIDTERRIIHIPEAKAGAREQPITANLANFLMPYMEALREGTPWLFPSKISKSGHTVDIRKAFHRIVVDAGLNPDEVVPHTLRHTAISHLVQADIDLPTVQRVSGHKTLAMVARYAHQNGSHIQAAMDKLEARYGTTTG